MSNVIVAVMPEELDRLARTSVDAAYCVHKAIGPGLLESVYEVCLAHELRKRGLHVDTQVQLPVTYDSVRLEAGLRIDILVERQLVLELKSVLQMHPVFEAQLLSYLKLANLRLGLLINFNVRNIGDGIKRLAR